MPGSIAALRDTTRWRIAEVLHCPPSEQDRWTVRRHLQACDYLDLTGGD